MSRVVFVNRYYKPDHSATAQILTDLTEYLASENSEVKVLCSRLNYSTGAAEYPSNEVLNGVTIKRLWTSSFGRNNLIGRAFDYLTFYVSCLFYLLFYSARDDIVVVKTDPPLISVVVATVSLLRKFKLICWVQDLFPEVASASGIKLARGVFGRCLCALRNWSLKRADNVVAIGDGMRNRLIEEGISEANIAVIPNWYIGSEPTSHDLDLRKNALRKEWGLQDKTVLLYSGNLGLAHDLELIKAVVRSASVQPHLAIVFIGGGAHVESLKQLVVAENISNVLFKPYQPIERLATSLSVANYHLVSLRQEMEGYIVPSKFYGAMAVQRPVIFLGSRDGELASVFYKHQVGLVAESATCVEHLIETLAADTQGQLDYSNRGFHIFAPASAKASWKQVLSLLTEPALCVE